MRGLLLAGGSGTRLRPITRAYSKHLLPIYDKPMIYYSLSTVMLAGVRDIAVVVSPSEQSGFEKLLGDGSRFGVSLTYLRQDHPEGIAQGLILAGEFLQGRRVCLVLGDNFFHGPSLGTSLGRHSLGEGAVTLAAEVADPRPYAVVELDEDGRPASIVEKPEKPKSNTVLTGLYFYPPTAVEVAGQLAPSERGELEITDLNRWFLKRGLLEVERLPRGTAWLDLGTWESLNDASTYVRLVEQRQGLKIGCPEEIAWRQGWISDEKLERIAEETGYGTYGQYLRELIYAHRA